MTNLFKFLIPFDKNICHIKKFFYICNIILIGIIMIPDFLISIIVTIFGFLLIVGGSVFIIGTIKFFIDLLKNGGNLNCRFPLW